MTEPRLSLCMIARDEASCIEECMRSAAAFVDEIIVVDTGSTDDTPRIAAQYGAKVFYQEWNHDFSKARNYSRAMASGDWILYLDADETLEPDDGPRLRELLHDEGAEGFLLLELNHFTTRWGEDFAPHITLRLFRNLPEYRFVGRIHEAIDPAVFQTRLSRIKKAYQVRIHHYGYMLDNPRLQQKINRNLEILKMEFEASPEDPFICFNLGTEYFRMGQYDQAYTFYAKARDLAPLDSLFGPRLIKNSVIALLESGRPEEAKRQIWRGLLSFPDFNELYYYWGDLALRENKPSLALQCFAECQFLPAPPPHYNTVSGLETYRSNIAMANCYRLLKRPLLETMELLKTYLRNQSDDCLVRIKECWHRLTPEEQFEVQRFCLENLLGDVITKALELERISDNTQAT